MADAALYQAKRQRNTWVGLCGTIRALQLPSIQEAIEGNAAALTMQDKTGKRYLDGIGGLWCMSLGFGEEEMAQAVAEGLPLDQLVQVRLLFALHVLAPELARDRPEVEDFPD